MKHWTHAAALGLVFLFMAPSRAIAEKGKRALVVIDMQEYFMNRSGGADRPSNVEKLKALTEAQLDAIEIAEFKNVPIIFLEYDGFGATIARLKGAAQYASEVAYFRKDVDGMLSPSNSHVQEIKDYLAQHAIETLVIMGANGGACVYSSIFTALKNNYSVIAYTDGIADFNFANYIYPYTGHYAGKITPDCADCTLRESRIVDELFDVPYGPIPSDDSKQELVRALSASRASAESQNEVDPLGDVEIRGKRPTSLGTQIEFLARRGKESTSFYVTISSRDENAASKLALVETKAKHGAKFRLSLHIPSFSFAPSGSRYLSKGVGFSGEARPN